MRCPVLAIQGYDDEYGSMAQLDDIASRVAGPCELLKLERCGHAPFRDQPEQTLAALTRFINQRTWTPRRSSIRSSAGQSLWCAGRSGRLNCCVEVRAAASDMICTLCMPAEQASIWIWQAQSR